MLIVVKTFAAAILLCVGLYLTQLLFYAAWERLKAKYPPETCMPIIKKLYYKISPRSLFVRGLFSNINSPLRAQVAKYLQYLAGWLH